MTPISDLWVDAKKWSKISVCGCGYWSQVSGPQMLFYKTSHNLITRVLCLSGNHMQAWLASSDNEVESGVHILTFPKPETWFEEVCLLDWSLVFPSRSPLKVHACDVTIAPTALCLAETLNYGAALVQDMQEPGVCFEGRKFNSCTSVMHMYCRPA